MSTLSSRPFLVVYVVWHPGLLGGEDLANVIHDHFRRDLFTNVSGGTGLSVQFRFTPHADQHIPISIDFEEAESSAVIVLLDEHLCSDSRWLDYVDELVRRAEATGLRARVFPVAMDDSAYRIGGNIQSLNYIRWSSWFGDALEDRYRKVIAQLAYEFCRILRRHLEFLKNPGTPESELERYLKKVRVFLSHSKHDSHGDRIARAIRASIHEETGLDSFFDVLDIPAGLPFADVLMHYVRVSAVVALHTDSYSSREWCRREIIEAKRANVPLVVANCITDFEERGFPYLGNVPVVRLEPDATHRISYVVARLLDEVLKDFLWWCRVELASRAVQGVDFLPRSPELISLVELASSGGLASRTVVYPDPPLGLEELGLIETLSPGMTLRSYTQWLAELTV